MDIKIFVIHYKKLTDRKNFIINQFKKFNLTNYEFVSIDRDELDNYDISIFTDYYKRPNNKYNLAITLSHFYAINNIKNNYEKAIIFEDDVIFSNDFIHKLEKTLKELPSSFDMAFIGDGCNLHIPYQMQKEGQFLYRKCVEPTDWGGDGITRCADSYILSNKGASIIDNYIEEEVKKNNKLIDHNIDWWFNIVGRDTNLEVYWTEPTFVTQGSQNSSFNCSYIRA